MLRDPSAEPAHDWNERVCAECYTPNSCAKLLDADGRIRAVYNNYSKLSFDFGPTLHRWLEGNYPTLTESSSIQANGLWPRPTTT